MTTNNDVVIKNIFSDIIESAKNNLAKYDELASVCILISSVTGKQEIFACYNDLEDVRLLVQKAKQLRNMISADIAVKIHEGNDDLFNMEFISITLATQNSYLGLRIPYEKTAEGSIVFYDPIESPPGMNGYMSLIFSSN